MISAYSLISAMVFFNLALIIVYLMRHNTDFLIKYSTTALMLLFVLGVVRLLTPLDLPQAIVIPSMTILPWAQRLAEKPTGGFTVGQWLLLLWAIGTAMVLVIRGRELVLSWHGMRRMISIDCPQVHRISQEFGLSEKAVVVSPEVAAPQAAGLFRPHIYLPCLELSDDELRWIFRHELIHINGHDTWVKLFYLLLEAVFWWNPVVHSFQKELDSVLELRCDAKLGIGIDDGDREKYLGAVLSVLKQLTCSSSEYIVAAQAFAKPGDDVKQRFCLVLECNEKNARAAKTALLCGMVLCFVLSYFVIVQPYTLPPPDEIEGAFEIDSGNAYFRLTEDGKYLLYVNGQLKWEIDSSDMHREPYSKLQIIYGGK